MASISFERQQKILELLEERKTLKIQELVDWLRVSPMTIHRDLQRLSEAGRVTKVHGGVTQARIPLAKTSPGEVCAFCGKPVSPRSAFVIRTPDGELQTACCPHCGLLMLSGQADVPIALATDFLYGQMVSAQQAVYLVESAVHTCCAPSVLSFAGQKDAGRFQRGFGGQVMDFAQVRKYLLAAMA